MTAALTTAPRGCVPADDRFLIVTLPNSTSPNCAACSGEPFTIISAKRMNRRALANATELPFEYFGRSSCRRHITRYISEAMDWLAYRCIAAFDPKIQRGSFPAYRCQLDEHDSQTLHVDGSTRWKGSSNA